MSLFLSWTDTRPPANERGTCALRPISRKAHVSSDVASCGEARNIPFKEGQLVRAVKAWYGLKTSPRHWNTKFSGDLKNFGFRQLPEDLCVFCHAELPLFVGVVVDDLIVVGENSAVAKFEAFLKVTENQTKRSY